MKRRSALALVLAAFVLLPSCLRAPGSVASRPVEEVAAGRTNCRVIEVVYYKSYSYDDALLQARERVYALGGNAYRVIAATGSSVTVQALQCGFQERNYLGGEEARTPEPSQ